MKIVLLLLIFCHNVVAQTIENTMLQIANNAPKIIKFKESTSSGFLKNNILSTGVIQVNDTSIIKTIKTPILIKYKITNNTITIFNKGNITTINTDKYLALKSSINLIQLILNGKLPQIREKFTIAYKSYDESWDMILVPKNILVLAKIKSITISGYKHNINYIKTISPNNSVLTTFYE